MEKCIEALHDHYAHISRKLLDAKIRFCMAQEPVFNPHHIRLERRELLMLREEIRQRRIEAAQCFISIQGAQFGRNDLSVKRWLDFLRSPNYYEPICYTEAPKEVR
jgi:hypothetical protein